MADGSDYREGLRTEMTALIDGLDLSPDQKVGSSNLPGPTKKQQVRGTAGGGHPPTWASICNHLQPGALRPRPRRSTGPLELGQRLCRGGVATSRGSESHGERF